MMSPLRRGLGRGFRSIGFIPESVTDASRIVLTSNLIGVPADGLVDTDGLLVNRGLLGGYGHERIP